MLVLVQSHQSLTFLSYQLLCGHIACGNISISTWPYAQKHKHNHLFKVCKQNHHLFNCKNFKSMKPQARLDVVKSNKICFLCLFSGYYVSVYQKAYRSLVPSCSKKHSKFIDVDTQQSRGDVTTVPSFSDTLEASASNASAKSPASRVYLPIVSVRCNSSHIAHALLDSGSTISFVSESLAKRLNLKPKQPNYNVNTLSSNTRIRSMVSLQSIIWRWIC